MNVEIQIIEVMKERPEFVYSIEKTTTLQLL